MKRASEADYRAFFADAYADALRFASRRTAPDHAEDAVAEAMLVAWRRFAEAPTEAGERRAWLFGIVRNTVLNANRSQARRSALAVRIGDGGVAESPDHADQVAQRLDLARAWRKLEDGQQEVLALTVFEGLTAAQSARVLGISAVAFRARLSRARRALHSHFSHPAAPSTSLTAQEASS